MLSFPKKPSLILTTGGISLSHFPPISFIEPTLQKAAEDQGEAEKGESEEQSRTYRHIATLCMCMSSV